MTVCARKGSHSKPEATILEGPACKVGPGWGLGTWHSNRSLNDRGGSRGLGCLHKPYGLRWAPASLLGIWNVGTCRDRQRMPTQPYEKNLRHQISNRLPWAETPTAHALLSFSLLEEAACSVWPLTGGRGHWESVHGILQTPPVCFPLADHVMYPVVVINLSCECNYTLSPMSACKSLHVVLATPKSQYIPNYLIHVSLHAWALTSLGSTFLEADLLN